MNVQRSTKNDQPFASPQAEVEALMMFAAEHENWRRQALNFAAEFQAVIFAGSRQLMFEFQGRRTQSITYAPATATLCQQFQN